jgi:hypothetical protein
MKKGIMLLLVCMLVAVGFAACGGGGGGAAGGGATVDNSRANGTFTFFYIDASTGFDVDHGTITFDGAGNALYSSLTTTDSGAFAYTVTVPGNTITLDGTTIGTLNAAGNFFAAVDTSNGGKFMITAVKRSTTVVTDTSVNYVGGDFRYDTGTTSAELFSIVTATPSGGVLSYTNLITSDTGTIDYALASNGTFTIDPTGAADTFGAISSDMNIMIFGAPTGTMQSAAVALKLPGSGMSNASLNGTYKGYEIMNEAGSFSATRYTLTFNGSGSGTATIEASSGGATGTDPFTYAVDLDGTFSIQGVYQGVVLQDGSVLGLLDPDPAVPAGDNTIFSLIAVKQ